VLTNGGHGIVADAVADCEKDQTHAMRAYAVRERPKRERTA
jgi:hypothetical protein